MTSAAGKPRPNKAALGLLSLIVLLGLGLRLWGLGWSLPNAQHPLATYHPDERVNLGATLNVDIPHGQLDTKFYSYGTFYFYLASFAQTVGRGYGLIPSTPPLPADAALSQSEQMTRMAPELAGLFLAGRIVTMLLGTATIAVLFALARRLYGQAAALLAALLYAIAPLAVVHAHFLTVDVPATFFVTLALLCAARLLSLPMRRDYVFAGIACGLCAATKYNTVLVLAAPVAAHLLSGRLGLEEEKRRRGEEETKIQGTGNMSPRGRPEQEAEEQAETGSGVPASKDGGRRGGLWLLLGTTAIAFLAACPGPLLNWNVFWNGAYPDSGVRYELFEHSRIGHGLLFVQTGPGWWYHLIVSLPHGLGIPLLLLSLAGVAYACRQHRRADLILLAFLLLYYGTTGLSAVRFARYMLPLFPVLCLLAARLVCAPLSSIPMRRAARIAGGGAVIMAGAYTFSLCRLMTLPDPRDVSAAYLDAHAPQGASVAFGTVPWFYSPPLSPRFGELSAGRRRVAAQEITRYALRIPPQDWDQSVLDPLPDYVILSNLETMHARLRLHQDNAFQFTDVALPDRYRQTYFDPAPLWFAPGPTGPIIPEDLLYIMPTITVYEKR